MHRISKPRHPRGHESRPLAFELSERAGCPDSSFFPEPPSLLGAQTAVSIITVMVVRKANSKCTVAVLQSRAFLGMSHLGPTWGKSWSPAGDPAVKGLPWISTAQTAPLGHTAGPREHTAP